MIPDFRVRQRDHLLEITRAITSRLELGEALKLILRYAAELLQGSAGVIALRDEREVYRIRATYGVNKSFVEQVQPLLLMARGAQESQTLLERNLLQVTQNIGHGLEVIWLPLSIGEEVLGNLYVLTMRGGAFSQDDLRLLQSFADQAAIAVHNAQLVEQLQAEKQRLNLADEMKSTFIAAVSHELKTPVAIIKGYAGTLANPGAKLDDALIRDSAQVIDEESDRLTELINNMLDASRAQGGGFKLSPVELDIDELVVRTVRKFQSQTRRHTLATDISPDTPLVWADEARITQVLGNLIGNAIKYSPEGGKITIFGSSTDAEVIIAVKDEGKGIAPADQPHVFDRFYRAQDAMTKRVPGTGLGLYLARIFVEAHHGRIWLHSDGQTGSMFYFSLPRSKQDNP